MGYKNWLALLPFDRGILFIHDYELDHNFPRISGKISLSLFKPNMLRKFICLFYLTSVSHNFKLKGFHHI